MTEKNGQEYRVQGRVAKDTGEEPCCIKESALQCVLKWTNKILFYKRQDQAQDRLALA